MKTNKIVLKYVILKDGQVCLKTHDIIYKKRGRYLCSLPY